MLTRRQALGGGLGGLALLTLAACGGSGSRSETRADLVVYGGTPSGIMAAVAAAHHGLDAVLVLGESPLGGMVTNGLGKTDLSDPKILGGWTKEFFDQVGAAYGTGKAQYTFAPSVALKVFTSMLNEAGVKVVNGTLKHVTAVGGVVGRMELDDGTLYSARTFVDASYEGDLIGHAGLPYAYGRESRSRYGEQAAGFGIAPKTMTFDGSRAALPEGFLVADPDQAQGSGDDKTQSYNYRLCLTDDLARGAKWPKPDGYDADAFHALLPLVAFTGDINAVALPDGKFDLNNGPTLMTDVANLSWTYPTVNSPAARRAIAVQHENYVKGLMYHLANDRRVPDEIHAAVTKYALAADEFTDNGNWPRQLYVRESRRLVGRYVLTQADVSTREDRSDAVAYGAYVLDCHVVQRYPKGDGTTVVREGGIQTPEKLQPRYAIPLDVIRPRDADSNVLATVCASASHVAYCSLRMEPHYMLLGEAAGAAAAVAKSHGTGPGRVTPDEANE